MQAPEDLSKNTADALQGLHSSLDSVANILNERLPLDYLLSKGKSAQLRPATWASITVVRSR